LARKGLAFARPFFLIKSAGSTFVQKGIEESVESAAVDLAAFFLMDT